MTENMEHTKVNKEDTLLDLLQEDVEAEESDNEKYLKLANHADQEYPDRGYGSILRDIAKEENIHHKHLIDIINDIHKHK